MAVQWCRRRRGAERERGQYSIRKELNFLPVSGEEQTLSFTQGWFLVNPKVNNAASHQQEKATAEARVPPLSFWTATGTDQAADELGSQRYLGPGEKGGAAAVNRVSLLTDRGRAEGGGRVMEGIEPTLCSSRACALPSLA